MKKVILASLLLVGLLSFGLNAMRAQPSPYAIGVHKVQVNEPGEGMKFVVRSQGKGQPSFPDRSWSVNATRSHKMFCRKGAFRTKDFYRGFVVKIAAEEDVDDTLYKTAEINIGCRRSVDEGNRASLRMLSRLLKRYRNRSNYTVRWSVIHKGTVKTTVTGYARVGRENNHLFRDYIDDAEGLSNIDLDETFEKDIHVVARKYGTFTDIRKRIAVRR